MKRLKTSLNSDLKNNKLTCFDTEMVCELVRSNFITWAHRRNLIGAVSSIDVVITTERDN